MITQETKLVKTLEGFNLTCALIIYLGVFPFHYVSCVKVSPREFSDLSITSVKGPSFHKDKYFLCLILPE